MRLVKVMVEYEHVLPPETLFNSVVAAMTAAGVTKLDSGTMLRNFRLILDGMTALFPGES